jgi:hypothetical protein
MAHGWRKVQPESKHPKGDPAMQEGSKKLSQDVAACLSNKNNLLVRLMFRDEARFGRMSDPRSGWGPSLYHPVVDLA